MMTMRFATLACLTGLLVLGCGGNPTVIVPGDGQDGSSVGTGGDDRPDTGPDINLGVGGNNGDAGAGTGIGNDMPCGNSVIDDGETCDDGNNDPGDGCDASCHVEDG